MHENNIKSTTGAVLVKAVDILFGTTLVMNYKGVN